MLDSVVGAAVPSSDPLSQQAHRSVRAAISLLDHAPLRDAPGIAPSEADVRALAAEGRPWRSLAPVTRALLTLRDVTRLDELALRLVAPVPELAWRLFHLAILGEVLHALRTAGARVISLRPLGDTLSGPAYAIVDSDGRSWDLWFEAAGAWRFYSQREPYPDAAAGVPGAGGALGTDLMLIRPGERALLLECKYSSDPAIVARGGYEQVLAYAAEAFELANDLTAVVVGPDDVVLNASYADTVVGNIGIVPPQAIPVLVEAALTEP